MGLLNALPPPPRGKKGWPWTKESNQPAPKKPDGEDWPRISLVTPSYNQGCYIEETIRSVLLQNYPNLEYIIIDGGSTDKTVEIIKKYEPWLTHWASEPDRGQSHAINKGFKRCSGDIYNWLCSDDILLPNSLEFIAKKFDLTAPYWLIGGTQTFDEISGTTFIRPFKQSFSIVNFLLWQTMCVPQPSTFWNRHLQESIGGLNENLHFCMDTDLWLRFFHVTAPVFTEFYFSRYRVHDEAKTATHSPQYQKSLNEFSTWLLNTIEKESQGVFRSDLIDGLAEIQQQNIAWNRVREHVVLGRILRWWRKFINPTLPIL